MPYNANTSIVRTNNTFRQGELARKRVHRQGQEGDSALPFWWICYGILPEWSKGADLRSARRLSAWVQTPQVPIVLHFLFIRIWCEWVWMWVRNFPSQCVLLPSFHQYFVYDHLYPSCIWCTIYIRIILLRRECRIWCKLGKLCQSIYVKMRFSSLSRQLSMNIGSYLQVWVR